MSYRGKMCTSCVKMEKTKKNHSTSFSLKGPYFQNGHIYEKNLGVNLFRPLNCHTKDKHIDYGC